MMAKRENRMKTFTNGDIDMEYEGIYYEYHSWSNRYYRLDDGRHVSAPDGSLAKRRISEKEFVRIMKKIEKGRN